jgi:hypothetical protein
MEGRVLKIMSVGLGCVDVDVYLVAMLALEGDAAPSAHDRN